MEKTVIATQEVPKLFFGTSMKPFLQGEDCSVLLDTLFEMGVTAFDTARVYGKAESALGNWLERSGKRKDVVLLSKGGHPNPLGMRRVNEKALRRDLAVSCRLLKTDYIDFYLLHRDDPRISVGEIVEVCNALCAEGKIRAFGGSNWTHTRLAEANEYAYAHNLQSFSLSSPYFGLGEMVADPWKNGTVSIAGDREALKWYRQSGMPVLAYSSLGHGLFSGKVRCAADMKEKWARRGFGSADNFERARRAELLAKEKGCTVAQIALAWLFTQGMNVIPIVSTSSPVRMRENIAALSLPLTAKEADWLNLKHD